MNKKLLTFLLAAACAATCAVGISACGEGAQNENPGEIEQENTADIYVFSHAEAVGGSHNWAELDEIEAMYAGVMFVFEEDGTVTLYLGDQAMEGTYTTAEDGTVTCDLPIGDMSFTISGDSFTVVIAVYGSTAYYGTFVLDNDATIPAPPEENPGETDTAMTEEEWAEAIAADYPQYSFFAQRSTGEEASLEYDGVNNLVYIVVSDGTNASYMYLAKEGENYYRYSSVDNASWTRETITQGDYSSALYSYTPVVTLVLDEIVDDYSQFTYADGRYTAVDIRIESMGIAEEVWLEFENGAIKTFGYTSGTTDDNMTLTIEMGEVAIELPENFSDL